jgi:hypothetical protein
MPSEQTGIKRLNIPLSVAWEGQSPDTETSIRAAPKKSNEMGSNKQQITFEG